VGGEKTRVNAQKAELMPAVFAALIGFHRVVTQRDAGDAGFVQARNAAHSCRQKRTNSVSPPRPFDLRRCGIETKS
jgi:hypothetical protein